jgi:hypothetical protein
MTHNNNYCFLLPMQYCSSRGLLLVDDSDKLFTVFHLLMVNAVSAVAESFYKESNNGRKDNNFLRNWVSCVSKVMRHSKKLQVNFDISLTE